MNYIYLPEDDHKGDPVCGDCATFNPSNPQVCITDSGTRHNLRGARTNIDWECYTPKKKTKKKVIPPIEESSPKEA